MHGKRRWLMALGALIALALVAAGCGPAMLTPTPGGQAVATASAPTANTAAPTQGAPQPPATAAPVDVGELPVDPNDWHALGPADAPVIMEEYSDFQ